MTRYSPIVALTFAVLVLLLLGGAASSGARASLSLSSTAKVTRLLLKGPKGTAFAVRPSTRSDRLIVAMQGVDALPGLPNPAGNPHVAALHTHSQDQQPLELIVDLRTNAQFRTSLGTAEDGGPRLIVDVTAGIAAAVQPTPFPLPKAKGGRKNLVVAIDAGHGGKDTGAVGAEGTLEKDIVLAIARKLEFLLKTEPGIRPVLIRQSDEFIELRQRMERARQEHADLFVSLHADAYLDAHAKGASVFTLSQHGATSEAARRLADRENAVDQIGGVALHDKDEVLASVLLELAQDATLEASDRAAASVLQALQKTHTLHQPGIQKAGFVVLKSPDVPSLLVETAFISNPEEEQKLRNPDYQDQIAKAIAAGIRTHLKRSRPAGMASAGKSAPPPYASSQNATEADKAVK
ncbi:MAG: N-acetylmuramoyl-L-alanine amidase [Methylococcus sp.]|nr:N-acetylmuramoyl-L-alanine amidase [Methylococcus sp.]